MIIYTYIKETKNRKITKKKTKEKKNSTYLFGAIQTMK